MPTFKKTFTLSLITLLLLSLSAFTNRANKSTIPPQSHNYFQAADNPKVTAVAQGSIQSSAPEKKQKINQPTKTPKPTGTPPVIPPPADPGASNIMVGLALVSVIIILFGFWLNRQRVF